MGKGSKPRTPSPYCSPEQFSANWDAIFKTPKQPKKKAAKHTPAKTRKDSR